MGWTKTYQGGKFTDRGYDILLEGMRLTPFQIDVGQGGFNPGVVSASAGTHDREAWDINGSLLTPAQRTTVETNYRKIGCFAAVRTPAQGFTSYHIHVVPIGGDLSPSAADQVRAYKAGRNGLADNGPDTGDRSYVNVTWESYKSSSAYRPPIDTGGGAGTGTTTKEWYMSMSQDDKDAVRMAVKLGVTDASRGETFSGAADRSKNGVGENTQAVHELGDRLSANLDGLAGKLDQLIALLSK